MDVVSDCVVVGDGAVVGDDGDLDSELVRLQ